MAYKHPIPARTYSLYDSELKFGHILPSQHADEFYVFVEDTENKDVEPYVETTDMFHAMTGLKLNGDNLYEHDYVQHTKTNKLYEVFISDETVTFTPLNGRQEYNIYVYSEYVHSYCSNNINLSEFRIVGNVITGFYTDVLLRSIMSDYLTRLDKCSEFVFTDYTEYKTIPYSDFIKNMSVNSGVKCSIIIDDKYNTYIEFPFYIANCKDKHYAAFLVSINLKDVQEIINNIHSIEDIFTFVKSKADDVIVAAKYDTTKFMAYQQYKLTEEGKAHLNVDDFFISEPLKSSVVMVESEKKMAKSKKSKK